MEEQFEKFEDEFQSLESGGAWLSLFQRIRHESMYDLSCQEAKSMANKQWNRYRDVNPYDHTRVVLTKGTCNYINASLVEVEKAGRRYILTQGPLPKTSGHFWLMVWEQKSKAILMLNKVIEKDQIKCHQYWPNGDSDGSGNEMVFADERLKVTLLSTSPTNNFIRRRFQIEDLDTTNTREVLQFHYVTWPDFGVPSSSGSFLHFLQEVRDSGALENDVGPAVVHCSAGIGRSGTFCLVDSCLLMMKEGIEFDVKEILLGMRKCRMGLIQTADQLKFSYLAILEGARQLKEGKKRFDVDDNRDIIPVELPPPRLPVRITSLPGTPYEPELPQRPLPPPPGSSSSSECSDVDLVDSDDSDLDDSSENAGSKQETAEAKPDFPAHEEVIIPKSENGHASVGDGDSEATLRRRAKVDATMAKVREIKQKQKESEMSSELYDTIYRSLTGKRFLFCLGFSLVAVYMYSKF